MSYFSLAPEWVTAAAADLAGIGSKLGAAGSAAAGVTTSVLPAGADEISAAVAGLFGAHGQAFQEVSARVGQFHDQFVQALRNAAGAYASAEAASVQALAAPGGLAQQLEAAVLGLHSNLLAGEQSFNDMLLANELAWEKQVFGTDSALNGALNRVFNAGNLLVGTGEQALNVLVGARTPANFIPGLLTGSAAQVFNGGQIGGLVGAFDQALMVPTDLLGLVSANAGPAAAVGASVQAAAAAAAGPFGQLESAQLGFNANLLTHETTFNNLLLTNELAFEKQVFGTDSALNGALNRAFNFGNLMVGTGEQALNVLLGAPTPANFTASLLTGGPAQSFNSGEIGGLPGIFGQGLIFGQDVLGLLAGNT
ncbi:PE family protein [Mycobacterium vicinigordonae]|uniref:PE family protein n=1 Tax=Mycobacterium vicinigordonae TaxID=1719132 RepID=A0A7D6HN35_9MYCO|nr:PE family protein [Mycobacterium vicinigordonae]QLL06331.1 PE family protein [Mycobacterium vicinigordonae]